MHAYNVKNNHEMVCLLIRNGAKIRVASYETTPPHKQDDDDGEIGRSGAKKGGTFT
jgi:hypothetical protein